MRAYFILSLAFFLLSVNLKSQTIISGKVMNPLTREFLAFVNIGIKNKNIGTTSLSDGSFSIAIPPGHENDSLTFSLVGYSGLTLSAKNSVQKLIPLFPGPQHLEEVVVSTTKLSEKKFGLKRNSLIRFIDASMNQNDIFEIAQLVKLPSVNSKLTSLNLFIAENNDDSVAFRINFYNYNVNRPAERLNEKSILLNQPLKEGWLHCDISKFNMYAKNEIVVAFEFLPSRKRKKPISYEVKLGGHTKSFARSSSQGEWTVPPHHYLLYLTALVESKKLNATDEEEKETQATTKIFSHFVQDSFSLFVHLPASYKKNKTKNYPLVFLLDANAYFDIIGDYLEKEKSLPEIILIGIGYQNAIMMDSLRDRDYTYPKAIISDSCRLCGGANKFREFILKELIPNTQKTYCVLSDEITVMGHSLGGYFPAWSLLQDLKENNKTIKNYICISPSLEYADNYLSKEFKNVSFSNSLPKKTYICFGGKDDEMTNITSKGVLTKFEDQLKILGITYQWQVFPFLAHMETPVPGFEQGLHFILKK